MQKNRLLKLQAKAEMLQLQASKRLAEAGTPEQMKENVLLFLDGCLEEGRTPPPRAAPAPSDSPAPASCIEHPRTATVNRRLSAHDIVQGFGHGGYGRECARREP